MTDRIVVTGLGCVTASGNGIQAFEASLESGRSGVSIEGRSPEGWTLQPEPVDFEGRVSRLVLRKLDRTMQSALSAALEASEDAGLHLSDISDRRGVVVGTGFAGTRSSHEFIRSVWEHGPAGADPSLFPNTVPNGPAGQLSIFLKACGPGTNFFEADTAGESAIAYAMWELQRGDADQMIVCGVDERSQAAVTAEAFYRRAAGGADPDGVLRPFDADRSGTAIGAACAAVVLERETDARARGARPLGVVGPVALGAEPSPPGHWPTDPESYLATMRAAISEADIGPRDLSVVNASACGSGRFDAYEASALGRLGVSPPVTAPAGLTGRLAASGILRLVISVSMLRTGVVPPTARLRSPDPALPVSAAVEAKRIEARNVLQVGSGIGGGHAALVVSLP